MKKLKEELSEKYEKDQIGLEIYTTSYDSWLETEIREYTKKTPRQIR